MLLLKISHWVLRIAFAGSVQEVPPFTLEQVNSESAVVFKLKSPAQHHFNLKAPKKLLVSNVEATLTQQSEAEISFEMKGEVKGKTFEASAFLCDDANTYCIKKVVKGEVGGLARAESEPTRIAQNAVLPGKKDELGFWDNNELEAFAEAKKTGKKILIDFYGIWCPPCNLLNETVFPTSIFKNTAQSFVLLKMDADSSLSWKLKDRFAVAGYPTLIVTNEKYEELDRIVGAMNASDLTERLRKTLKGEPRDLLVQLESLLDRIEWVALKEQVSLELEKRPDDLNLQVLERLAQEKKFEFNGNDPLVEKVFLGLKNLAPSLLVRVVSDWSEASKESRKLHETKIQSIISELRKRTNSKTLFIPGTEMTAPDVAFLQITVAEGLEDQSKIKVAYDTAIQEYLKFMKHYGNEKSRGQTLELAYLYREAGKTEEARKIYESLISRFPSEFTYYHHLSRLWVSQKKWDKAREAAEKSFQFSYGDNRVRVAENLVSILKEQGKLEEAWKLGRQVLAEVENPQHLKVRTGRYVKALEAKLAEIKKERGFMENLAENLSQLFFGVLNWLKSLHQSDTFVQWLSTGGVILITGIIFAETGLLLGFFLPGDSLLITAGVLANPANPNHIPGLSIWALQIALVIAAIVGDQLGYFLGRRTGELIFSKPDGFLFKKKHVERAQEFYKKYGVFAIIACRFVPIMRTFVPFIAGVAKMNYRKYLAWDIFGGFLWITSLIWVGFYLGQTEFANRLDKIIVIVILVSISPMVISVLKSGVQKRMRKEA